MRVEAVMGPCEQNRALKDFKALIDILINTEKDIRFLEYGKFEGLNSISEPVFSINAEQQLIFCEGCNERKRNRIYNVSLLCRSANLFYYFMSQDHIQTLSEKLNCVDNSNKKALMAQKLESTLGAQEKLKNRTCLSLLEEEVLESYMTLRCESEQYLQRVKTYLVPEDQTDHFHLLLRSGKSDGQIFSYVNDLLRGYAFNEYIFTGPLKSLIFQYTIIMAALVVSGNNKLVGSNTLGIDKKPTESLWRYMGVCSTDEVWSSDSVSIEYLMPGQPYVTNGLWSTTSSKDSFGVDDDAILKIAPEMKQWLYGFDNFENEYIIPPGIGIQRDDINSDFYLVTGPAVERSNRYLFELALAYAKPILKQKYTGEAEIAVRGVARPNHDFTHALRSAWLVPRIIAFLDADGLPAVQAYCSQLTSNDIQIMMVMSVFFAIGRQSEDSYSEDPILYNSYRQASAAHLRSFLLTYTDIDESRIVRFAEILEHVYQDDFVEQLQQEDKYLAWIIAFAHDLDAHRFESKEVYRDGLQDFVRQKTKNFISPHQSLAPLFLFAEHLVKKLFLNGDNFESCNKQQMYYAINFIQRLTYLYDHPNTDFSLKSTSLEMAQMEEVDEASEVPQIEGLVGTSDPRLFRLPPIPESGITFEYLEALLEDDACMDTVQTGRKRACEQSGDDGPETKKRRFR